MEKLYRKKENGRYEPVEYCFGETLHDGIWMINTKENSKSYTSVAYRLGDLKRPVDVVTQAALLSFTDDLSLYLLRLSEEDSEEYKEAKEILGNWLQAPVGYANISAADLSALFLRKIAEKLEKGTVVSWGKIFIDFRQNNLYNTNENAKLLSDLEKFLKERGYELRQNK